MYALDEDIHVVETSPGVFAGRVTPRWNVGPFPNGGYLLALGLGSMARVAARPDPLTATAHYLRPTSVGPCELHIERVKEGRLATLAARLVQDGKERVRYLATFGDLSATAHPAAPWVIARMAPAVAPRGVTPVSPFPVEMANRVEVEFDALAAPWTPRDEASEARLLGRIRLIDGREPDLLSLALFADAFPPAVFRVLAPGWVPTVELTVHFRRRPSPGWLTSEFRSRYVSGGYLDEDGEIWDSTGQLVALSRQIAGAPRAFG